MKEIIQNIADMPLAVWLTLTIGFVSGAMVVALYFTERYISMKREIDEMKHSLGRPIK